MTFFSPLRAVSIVATTIAFPFLSSCDSGSKDGSGGVGELEPSHQKAAILTAKISDLVEHDSGAVTYNGELFSGRAIERNAGGGLLREHYYYEGYLQGPVREFYENGSTKSDTQYDKGVANGIAFEWDSAGEMTQILYEDGVEAGRATREPSTAPTSAGN